MERGERAESDLRRRHKGKKGLKAHIAKLITFPWAGLAIDKSGPVNGENLRIEPVRWIPLCILI